MLPGNRDRLAPPGDRPQLRAALKALLQGKRPPRVGGLSPRGTLVWEAARAEAPVPPDRARRLIEPLAADIAVVRPGDAAPRAHVFLLHGAADPIIPPDNARALEARLAKAGVKTTVCVSSLFAHVEPTFQGRPSLFRAWPLLRFTARFLKAAGLDP